MEVATASVADTIPDVSVDIPDAAVDAPSPSADADEASSDEIFDKAAKDYDTGKETPAETEVKPVEAKLSSEAVAEPAKAAVGEEPTDVPFEQVIEPENLKKAWKSLQKGHPEVAKTIRDSWYKTKAYEENFTVPEVRELRQIFSTPAEAKEARQAQADLLAFDDALHNKPIDLLAYLHKGTPQGFSNLATALPKALYAIDPALYRQQVSEPAVNHFHEFFGNVAQQTGDEDLKAAIEIIKDRAQRYNSNNGGQPQAQVQRGPNQNDPVYARLQELEKLNSEREAQSSQTFKDSVDVDFQKAVSDDVLKAIERSGADINDDGKQEIVNRVMSDVLERIQQDQLLQRQLAFSVNRPGAVRDAAQHKQLVDKLAAHAKRFSGQAISTHMKWLTEKILSNNRQQLTKQSKVTSHKEVTGAAASSTPGTKLTKQQISTLTPDELFDAAAKGQL